jgi:hypothetical protein
VFFEKKFESPRGFVLMDGQGKLTPETIMNCLCLTNIALVHFHSSDLGKKDECEWLKAVLTWIRNNKPNKIRIVLLIRDTMSAEVLKEPGD